MRRRVPLALAALVFGVLGAAAPATPAHAAVVKTQNDSTNGRWLVVIAGNGYRHDLPPNGGWAYVNGGGSSRKVWVPAGCTTYKDGVRWDSSPPQGGHYKSYPFQVLTANFKHYC